MITQRLIDQLRRLFIKQKIIISYDKHQRSQKKVADYWKISEVQSHTKIVSSVRRPKDIFSHLVGYLDGKSKMAVNIDATLTKFAPSPSVRGMKLLDKKSFITTVNVPSIRVPVENIQTITKRLKKRMLKLQGVRPVAELPGNDEDRLKYKVFLFDPAEADIERFNEDDKEFLEIHGVLMTSFRHYELSLGYDNWRYSDILDAVLPEDSDGIGGFSQIGHIIHLNIKDQLLEYKQLIGEVLLDKVSTARTVVNKLGTIDNTYRNFNMEIIAGDEDTLATVKEWGVNYKFDFAKVYWNPRLSTEHKRVVEDLDVGDVAYDVFAGVGPFAVPAARKGVIVLANDLNPESYKWLNHNAKINKLRSPLKTFNLDGRDFIRDVVRDDMLERWKGIHEDQKQPDNPDLRQIHFFMNLPALAVTFLDVFPGLYRDVDPGSLPHLILPRVHCHCFSKSEEPMRDAVEQVEAVIGSVLNDSHQVRTVRNVAPNKDMLCVSFTLNKDVLFRTLISAEEPPEKMLRLN